MTILYYTFSLECDTLHSYSTILPNRGSNKCVYVYDSYASHSFSISVENAVSQQRHDGLGFSISIYTTDGLSVYGDHTRQMRCAYLEMK